MLTFLRFQVLTVARIKVTDFTCWRLLLVRCLYQIITHSDITHAAWNSFSTRSLFFIWLITLLMLCLYAIQYIHLRILQQWSCWRWSSGLWHSRHVVCRWLPTFWKKVSLASWGSIKIFCHMKDYDWWIGRCLQAVCVGFEWLLSFWWQAYDK